MDSTITLNSDQGHPNDDVAQRKHKSFIEALERFGGGNDGDEWEKMAASLQSSVWEVKIYSYRYMHQLCNSDETNECFSSVNTQEDNTTPMRQPQQPTLIPPDNITTPRGNHPVLDTDATDWTYDDSIVFDNLLALYPPSKHDDNSNTSTTIWEKISAMMPNKNSLQCRNRYFSKYYHRDYQHQQQQSYNTSTKQPERDE